LGASINLSPTRKLLQGDLGHGNGNGRTDGEAGKEDEGVQGKGAAVAHHSNAETRCLVRIIKTKETPMMMMNEKKKKK
jgi:hypothetical protein